MKNIKRQKFQIKSFAPNDVSVHGLVICSETGKLDVIVEEVDSR